MRIIFFHLINRIFEHEEIDDNLRIYYIWKNKSGDINGLSQWIAQDED